MAKFSFCETALSIKLNPLERLILGRPYLVLDNSRLLSFYPRPFPGKKTLGSKVSKRLPLGVLGEYKEELHKTLVLGSIRESSESVKIRVSHPSLDEIWVCGPKGVELEKQLQEFLKSR